jgi:ribosome-associated toxin RatA of RatAB toxin-antitoxin module
VYTYKIARLVDAPAAIAWEVISDVEGYHKYAPNLSNSQVLEGEGEGMRRRCHNLQGRGWNERCVLWKAGQAYSMEVDTGDYPYPFRKMQGTWSLEQRPDGVLVKMQFDYQPEFDPPLLGPLVDRLLIRPTMSNISQELMSNWLDEISKRAQEVTRSR